MKKYIDLAIRTIIDKNSPLVLSKNSFYYRNRVIDAATLAFEKDPHNLRFLHSWVKEDIITSEDRSRHFGLPIGTSRGYITSPKDAAFYNKIAKIKLQIKKEITL